jgi:hypothetical protein
MTVIGLLGYSSAHAVTEAAGARYAKTNVATASLRRIAFLMDASPDYAGRCSAFSVTPAEF